MRAGERAPLFVLVHSPLVGPLTWQLVADVLRRSGHEVTVPRLDNEAPAGTPLYRYHAERVRRSVEAHDPLAPVVLVGHSGAGPLLPLIGDTLVNDVAGYVFADAPLPRDRARRSDNAPAEFRRRLLARTEDGRVPPWGEWWRDDVLAALIPDEELRKVFVAELCPLPLQLFEEPIPLPPEWPDAPCAYLRLSSTYDAEAAAAARRGWDVVHFEAGHLHMLVDPDAVAEALTDLAQRFRSQAPVGARAGAGSAEPVDPVAAARLRIARWVDLGRRVGFLALTVAVASFAVALYWGLPSLAVRTVIASLALAAVTLLPAIIVGYGVAAAEREERAREDRARGPGRGRGP